MKKSILILGTAMFLFIGSLSLSSCGSSETKTETKVKVEKEVYQCPMKCEGEKTYDKPGECPKCGMDIKKIENHDEH